MKLDWLTSEAAKALDKLNSAPYSNDPDKQRAHEEMVRKVINDDFMAQYNKRAQGGYLTLRQALRRKGVQAVAKFTRPRNYRAEPDYDLINTVDLVRREHRLNGTDHLDVLAVVVQDVDASVVEDWWHPNNYTLEGRTLYIWDWWHAILVTSRWSQADYDIHVLVGVV